MSVVEFLLQSRRLSLQNLENPNLILSLFSQSIKKSLKYSFLCKFSRILFILYFIYFSVRRLFISCEWISRAREWPYFLPINVSSWTTTFNLFFTDLFIFYFAPLFAYFLLGRWFSLFFIKLGVLCFQLRSLHVRKTQNWLLLYRELRG